MMLLYFYGQDSSSCATSILLVLLPILVSVLAVLLHILPPILHLPILPAFRLALPFYLPLYILYYSLFIPHPILPSIVAACLYPLPEECQHHHNHPMAPK